MNHNMLLLRAFESALIRSPAGLDSCFGGPGLVELEFDMARTWLNSPVPLRTPGTRRAAALSNSVPKPSGRVSTSQWISDLARAAANVATDQFVDKSDAKAGSARSISELARLAGRVAIDRSDLDGLGRVGTR
jgi:hypothetical protein